MLTPAQEKYCVSPTKCKLTCEVCQHNHFIDLNICRWCDTLLEGTGHTNEFGKFCGPSENSECAWLYREWVARQQ